MSKKSIFGAMFLIGIGIIFGAILVSNFHGGIESGFAGDPQVQLGAPTPIKIPNQTLMNESRGFAQVAKAVTPTVVSINVTMKEKGNSQDLQDFFHFFGPDSKFKEPTPQQGAGSGVIITPTGYVLTNNHVVEDADDDHIEVVTSNNHTYKAKLIGTDPTTDLAVLKIDGAKDLPTASLGNSDSLEVGDWVLAIGNPLGLQSTVTAGIISAVGRSIGIIRTSENYGIEDFIQTDAAINPGNSGGPLVNIMGEVIGINSAIATTNARYQGYGFAIPVNLAKSVAQDLIAYGKIRRGYIGVNIQTLTETEAKALGLDKSQGVLVGDVVKGGAAEAAGLKARDVILSVDGKDVSMPNELQMIVARHHPGDDVKLTVFRDGKTFEKTVQLRSRTDENVAVNNNDKDETPSETNMDSKSTTLEKLGLTVSALSSDDLKNAGVSSGVLVESVKPLGEAYNGNITDGDIILEADKQEIHSPKELRDIISRHKAGDAVLMRIKKSDSLGGAVVFTAVTIPENAG
jgi:serine protease Do